MSANVDLRQLAVRRDLPAASEPGRRRHFATRYLLPGLVLLGFVGVSGWAARESFLPSQLVTVVPVLTARGEVQEGGSPLFQAAGWVEPRPTPVLVTALAEGVIEELLVVEDQEVKAGEPIARLVDADARLALAAALADQQLRQAELAGMKATLAAARTNVAQPVQLEAALADAAAMLAQKETELGNIPFQLRASEARLQLSRIDYETKSRAAGAVPERTLLQAKSDFDAAAAQVEELKGREPRLQREVQALGRKRDALAKRLQLKTEETRQLGEAEANVQSAEAKVRQAEVALDAARLRLERMTVRAPISGRVLALVARPGSRVGMDRGTVHETSPVVSLYDPARLQIRADVRLEDVPRVLPGQQARIETPALSDPLDGEVLFATSQADIQKNTLQVKVAVKSPPAVLKPEMLVQVTFLSSAQKTGSSPERESLRLFVPRQLVETGESGARVWIADQAAGLSRSRSIKLGPGRRGELVEVVDGLNAADKLIAGGREGLREGQRITITGEDNSLGMDSREMTAPKGNRPSRTPAAAPEHGKH